MEELLRNGTFGSAWKRKRAVVTPNEARLSVIQSTSENAHNLIISVVLIDVPKIVIQQEGYPNYIMSFLPMLF